MSLKSKLKKFFGGIGSGTSQGASQIMISTRTDGLTASGLPSFISPSVKAVPNTILCNEGTTLRLPPLSSLITGTSCYREYVLQMQIASAIFHGYTPIVLSSNGQRGETYSVLKTIYYSTAINYISDSNESGFYNPFEGVSHSCIEEFFFQLVNMSQQQPPNGLLARNYINVCVKVFFASSAAIGGLITGQLNHMRLIQEIQSMNIPEQQKNMLLDSANSAQSVSVTVLSVIQDYLFKMQRASTSRPSMQINPIVTSPNVPRITIRNTNNGQPVRPGGITILSEINGPTQFMQQAVQPVASNGFNASSIDERKCFFLNVDNEVPRIFGNAPSVQCFQWYLSKTLQMEMNAKPFVRQNRILLIIEDLSSEMLDWYRWLIDLPNCILLLNYKDFHSKLADAPERRHQLLERIERMFFFSITNDASAQWTSEFFGSRTVPKIVRTDVPPRDFWEMIFRQQSVAHDEQEKPWFSKHEIHHLGDKGIVFSLRDQIFEPCYLEGGSTYEDKSYRGRVNFCTFSFR